MTNAEPRADIRYTPYQKEFFKRFVDEIGPGSVHLLLAPVGTGKSFAMAGTIGELARTGRLRRVLVLVPAALAPQWAYLLKGWGQDATVVQSRTIRVLREQLGSTPDNWPEGLYAMSIDLAKRADVRMVLSAATWDLVVVDEAHGLSGQRLQLVENLARMTHAPALLLATRTPDKGVTTLVSKAAIIDWRESVAAFRATSAAGAREMLVRAKRTYRRTVEEAAIAWQVIECARQLGRLRGMVLLQRASSSISSLEDSLVRWVETSEQSTDVRDMLEGLLEQVEQLRTDSRLDCFQRLVEELVQSGVKHVVAFCEYRATLDYLAAAIERLDFADFGLHSGMADVQRRETSAQFEADGGLLITTGAASEGLSLNFVEAAIHYDLPMSPDGFAQREGRYHRFGRNLPCTVYFFEDEIGALPLEGLLMHMMRKHELVKDELNLTPDDLFSAALKRDEDQH